MEIEAEILIRMLYIMASALPAPRIPSAAVVFHGIDNVSEQTFSFSGFIRLDKEIVCYSLSYLYYCINCVFTHLKVSILEMVWSVLGRRPSEWVENGRQDISQYMLFLLHGISYNGDRRTLRKPCIPSAVVVLHGVGDVV